MAKLVSDVSERIGVSPSAIAEQAMFMSHETYTPARGGSAGAEISSLRKAFGPAANRITIANTNEGVPWAYREDGERYGEGLRRAGLPEE